MKALLALGMILLGGLLGTPPASAQGRADCRLTGAQQRWIESALGAWDRVRERALRLPPAPLPRLVFFDNTCVFTLPESGPASRAMQVRFAGSRLTVAGVPHGGTIRLPNGRTVAARPVTFSSLLPDDSSAFVLIALEAVWRSDGGTRAAREDWDAYLRRAFVHEMTHARQAAAWVPAVRIAGGRVGLVDVDDDIVQHRFLGVAGFREAVEREIAMLYEAAGATGERRRQILRDALNLMRDRRERFFGGPLAPWSEIEQLWLDMEGAAHWAALAHVRETSPRAGSRQTLNVVRESRAWWSQEEGLALYLALDALVPDWPAQVFSASPRSSLELLEGALGHTP